MYLTHVAQESNGVVCEHDDVCIRVPLKTGISLPLEPQEIFKHKIVI